MPRVQVLGPLLSRFVCMCAGYGGPAETPAEDKKVSPTNSIDDTKPKTLLQKKGMMREVHIDKSTTIPLELYWELVRAGERAKERGQHHLTKGKRNAGTHLIMSDC
eukprot:gb/GFBE01061425.1/.p1 GENE.gb/GFBE01061425.1/~~gb/GFBE01061425.1/.p1  ORF type:complete len:106 (+),score=19.30 gb/GFBE01061425.1/:1-318(+)